MNCWTAERVAVSSKTSTAQVLILLGFNNCCPIRFQAPVFCLITYSHITTFAHEAVIAYIPSGLAYTQSQESEEPDLESGLVQN